MAGLTLADIDQVDLNAVNAVYSAADSNANGSTDIAGRLQGALESTPFEGDSGDVARASLTAIAQGLTSHAAECAAAARGAWNALTAFANIKTQWKSYQEYARVNHMTIDAATGAVTVEIPADATPEEEQQLIFAASELQRCLQVLLRIFNDADEDLAASIRAAAGLESAEDLNRELNDNGVLDSDLAAQDTVSRALEGDQGASAEVDRVLDSITPDQLAGRAPLTLEQQAIVGQMSAQMQGIPLDKLAELSSTLGDHGDIVVNSMQVMSDKDAVFATPGNLVPHRGGFDSLPKSVQGALTRDVGVPPVPPLSGGRTVPGGHVPFHETQGVKDLQTLSGMIGNGDVRFQQGSELDSGMLNQAGNILKGSPFALGGDHTLEGIFESAGRDHTAVSGKIINDNDFVKNMTIHRWLDDGASVRAMTAYLGQDTGNIQTGQAAHALAAYVGGQHDPLLNLPDRVGGGTHTLGQVNPQLVQGYAEALAPYQRGLIGDLTGNTPGFTPIEDVASGQYGDTRGLFAVLDSDPTAAQTFNKAAYGNILGYEHSFADLAAADPSLPGLDPRSDDAAQAAALHGLINGGANSYSQEMNGQLLEKATAIYDMKKAALSAALGEIPSKIPGQGQLLAALNSGLLGPAPTDATINVGTNISIPSGTVIDGQNQAAWDVATSRIAAGQGPGLAGFSPEFVPGGVLMTPEQVDAAGLDKSRYQGQLWSYVGDQSEVALQLMPGYYQTYQSASGINDPAGGVKYGP